MPEERAGLSIFLKSELGHHARTLYICVCVFVCVCASMLCPFD